MIQNNLQGIFLYNEVKKLRFILNTDDLAKISLKPIDLPNTKIIIDKIELNLIIPVLLSEQLI